jgi:NADPH-dependent curcumin reductase CurA
MARAWHLKSRPISRPGLGNFELKQIALPSLEEGQIHVRNLSLSVNPYMRPRIDDNPRSYIPPFKVDEPMDGGAIGEVLESRAKIQLESKTAMQTYPTDSRGSLPCPRNL